MRTDTGLSGLPIGRYVLEDLVAEHGGTALWRAIDPALQRPVGARLIPLDDPRIDDLRSAAQRAARVHDRRVVRVLDVVEEDGYLAVISEWVTGQPWSDLLTDRWSPAEATLVALEVGRALESAHQAGAYHGRLRPDSVMITDSREVRLRGLGVQAALWGIDPPNDPVAADVHGLGALLYAGLTGRWPGPGAGPTDGLPAAVTAGGRTALPGTVVPDIPGALDDIVARSVQTAAAPPDDPRYTDVTQCVDALDRAHHEMAAGDRGTGYAEGTDSATDRLVGRLGTVTIIGLAVAGILLLGWQLLANRFTQSDVSDPAPLVNTLPPVDTPLPEAPFSIVKAFDFDPYGDGAEGSDTAAQAVDHNRDTAWYTETYASADLNGKGGVGLVADLGAVRPVRAIDLKLVGYGNDFEILTAKDRPKSMKDFRKVVEVTAAGDAIMVRTPKARNARFVMVWLKQVPFNGAAYVGGIREMKVVG